ncbi:MAG: MFS transporter [Chloroflexales bacterium]|nr:MFS transporter [Chloroflexales bacterium]
MSTTAQTISDARVAGGRRAWVLAACCLASCAKNTEPPPWVFRPPATAAFNAGWATYGLWMSVVGLGALAFLLIGGVLGDIFGRRRVMQIGLGGLIAANLFAVVAPSAPWFVVSRFGAGAFGTLVLPLSLSMLYLAYADDELARARAIGVYVLITSTALLTAGLLGQLMKMLFDWRVTFAVPTALGALAFVLVRRETVESSVPHGRRFDVVGHAAWALTVLCLMVSLVAWGSDRPNAPLALAGALAGVAVGIGLIVWWDMYTPDSVFGQSQIQRRALVVLILFGLCMQFGFVAFVTQVRNVLQAVYGYGVVLATVALAPLALGMLAAVIVATRRLVNARPRPLLAGSILAGGVICALAAVTGAAGFYPWLGLLLLAFGAAMILANVAWTAVFLSSMPEDVVGVRTGINSSVFQLGGSLGSGIAAALLADLGVSFYERLLVAAGVPAQRLDQAVAALNSLLDPATPNAALDPAVGERLLGGYQIAYLAAYNRVLLTVAGVCLVGSLLAWFALPRRGPGATAR